MSEILVLEINEVPWKVINKFRADAKYQNIIKFFNRSENYTTYCVDKKGMLDPWVIWPTIHRGMGYKLHNIKNLGQDVSTFKGEPIWEVFLKKKYSIGVFGSLQSWPPKDPGQKGFYLPDTFAHNADCYPKSLKKFQEFNLQQVSKNGKVINKNSIYNISGIITFLSLPFLSVKMSTIIKIIFQMLSEIFLKRRLAFRPTFQTLIAWDIFKGQYLKKQTYFSTFFTNHIANIMHRYWDHIFSEKFSNSINEHRQTMEHAMKVLDNILGDVMHFCKNNKNLSIYFISGMGQDKVYHPEHEGYEAKIKDIFTLCNFLGLDKNKYTALLAMVPQIALEITDEKLRKNFCNKLGSIFTLSNKRLFSILEEGNSLSISILTPKLCDFKSNELVFKDNGNEKIIKFEDIGVEILKMDAGQAYHIPEGILSIYSENISSTRRVDTDIIKTDQIKSIILKHAGIV
tara:strand:- start:993 stop:2363 length:1371 start_codon:yes stop_codon:yes gene_type:complete